MNKARCKKEHRYELIEVIDNFVSMKEIALKKDEHVFYEEIREKHYKVCIKDGSYVFLNQQDFEERFETLIEEECTIAKLSKEDVKKKEAANKQTTYKGWEIIKMISEGQIAEGTEIEDTTCDEVYTYENGFLYDNCDYYIDTRSLAKGEFKIIKPRKLVTFKKALYDNLKIRHKTWSDIEFTTPQNILNHYTKLSSTDILADLIGDSEVWEVECD